MIRCLPHTAKRIPLRVYFSRFVDHMDHLVVFLETVARRWWGQIVDRESTAPASLSGYPVDEQAKRQEQVAVWNTLLELCSEWWTMCIPNTVRLNQYTQATFKHRDEWRVSSGTVALKGLIRAKLISPTTNERPRPNSSHAFSIQPTSSARKTCILAAFTNAQLMANPAYRRS